MKLFIIKLFLFLLPLILISYAVDIFISKELKKNHIHTGGEFSVWNDVYGGTVNSDIVIYGGSRAWVQIDPNMISDSLQTTAYNLGLDGYTFQLQYLRHLALLDHNKKPKIIIHSVDAFILQKNPNLWNADQFLPYMLFNERMKNAIRGFNGEYKIIDYQLPLIRYYGKKEAIVHAAKRFANPSGDTVVRVKGYRGRDLLWDDTEFDKLRKRVKFLETYLDTPTVILFEKYLNECKSQNIQVIFVYVPEYIEGQRFLKNREIAIELFTRLSKKYDIPFYDFSDDTIALQKEYYYNA
ncbi:MAG: hypothetical protein ABR503_13265, partial [Chitinophagaceae bacterium]